MLQFYCPNCGVPFTVREEWVGRNATCKKCSRKFTIPHKKETHPHEDILQYRHREKNDNEKYCTDCGEIINAKAEICPGCGVRQEGMVGASQAQQVSPTVAWSSISARQRSEAGRSKVSAGILALLVGGLGIHKFYLGRPFQGVLYVLFCWTWIPSIVGFIEGIIYLCRSQESFDRQYNC